MREQYPSKSRCDPRKNFVNGSHPHEFCREPAPADQPTDAAPGTEAKILVLQARVEARQQLFHPEDRINQRDD